MWSMFIMYILGCLIEIKCLICVVIRTLYAISQNCDLIPVIDFYRIFCWWYWLLENIGYLGFPGVYLEM